MARSQPQRGKASVVLCVVLAVVAMKQLQRVFFLQGKISAEPSSISRVKFSRKQILLTFTKREVLKPAIVYTKDARNGDLCQIMQYYGYGRTR